MSKRKLVIFLIFSIVKSRLSLESQVDENKTKSCAKIEPEVTDMLVNCTLIEHVPMFQPSPFLPRFS